ncbi:MAG TPA: hypothetical protein VFH90_03995, partial [Candidatus Limnocylindria bacterium]|nr:hypothetical protein [Candidatus Limnocylindria bacterium]
MPRTLALWIAFTGWGAMFAVAMVLAAVVLGNGAASAATSSATPLASGPIGTIEIRAFDLGFEPAMVHVSTPGRYTVRLANDGGTLHDVTFADGTKVEAAAHSTASGEVMVPAGGIGFICSVPGHADAGMEGEVMVSGEPGGTPVPSASLTAEDLRDADAARTAQFPAETEGKGNQVLEPTVREDGVKEWDLTASVIEWETEPG